MSISHLSLFKRSNHFWYILYTQEGRTKWKSTGETLKSKALKKLTEFKKLCESKPKPTSLSQFWNEFKRFAKANYSKTTLGLMETAISHLKSITGECLLPSITPEHVDRYKTLRLTTVNKLDRKVSPVTINAELRGLRSVFNTAIRWKLLESNPFAKLQMLQSPDVPPAYLSKEDFQKLLALINEAWLKDVIIFGTLTGMRRGEILNLKWSDIDLQRRIIQVQSSLTFQTKQGKRRVVPMNDIIFHMLTSRMNNSVSEFVFSYRNKQIDEDILTHRFKEYVLNAGLNPRLHFHSLRHTFASWLVQDGVSLYEVQKLLGHSNIAVTQVYSHLQPEGLHSTVNRISIPLN